MTLGNNTLLNGTYDLTKIFHEDIITNPVKWVATVNNELGGIMIVTFLAVIGIILFLAIRSQGASDTRAGSYAGLIVTIIGLMLFIARVVDDPAEVFKLLTWAQLLPFLVITAVFIILDKISRNY